MLRESGSLCGYPIVLTLHTLGLGVLVGASTVIAAASLVLWAAMPWGKAGFGMRPFVGNAF